MTNLLMKTWLFITIKTPLLIHCCELFHGGGVVKTYGFFNDSSHATHYLKFSVKITTNQLHYCFRKRVPFLNKEVSKMVLGEKYC